MRHPLEVFIEETLPGQPGWDADYKVVWASNEPDKFERALEQLASLPNPGRLEMWSVAHAESGKGFAPMAYREANSKQVMIGGMLKMLMHMENLHSFSNQCWLEVAKLANATPNPSPQ